MFMKREDKVEGYIYMDHEALNLPSRFKKESNRNSNNKNTEHHQRKNYF